MPQMDIFRIRCLLKWFSAEAACLTPGSISRTLIEEQIARLWAMLLPEGQTGDRTHGRLTSLVVEGELLTR